MNLNRRVDDLTSNPQHISDPQVIGGDRRIDRRYWAELSLKYTIVAAGRVVETGSGHSINISRGGICFETENRLRADVQAELIVNWPFLLQNQIPLHLCLYGRVIRTQGRLAVLKISRYEFRTHGARSFQPATGSGPRRTLFA